MRYTFLLRTGAIPAFLGLAACVDLNVENPNAPDRTQALTSAADVESLASRAYNTWFNGVYDYDGPGLALSVAAFQHSSPWACAGMEYFGRLPREPVPSDAKAYYYENWTRPWFKSYAAITEATQALAAAKQPAIASELGATSGARAKAFSYFVLGMAHATIGLLYDQGFVVDETTDMHAQQAARPYGEIMVAAIGYFDKALAGLATSDFTIPKAWIATDDDLPAADFARLIHSLKARYLVEVARTPAERAAVSWPTVVAEVMAGITSSFVQNMDAKGGWYDAALDYATGGCGWGGTPYFVWGMADQSGSYQLWLSTPLLYRKPIINGRDILIVTPDLRFPQGATLAEQTTRRGRYVAIPTPDADGGQPQDAWGRPDRGTWRWSYYVYARYRAYNEWTDFHLPEIPLAEMDMLKAEGLFRTGDRAGAAVLVNKTRVATGGLNATDAAGTNTSCVPKLPDGRCGDLFEMIKWEKRLEGAFLGLGAAPWYFDNRGWGELYKGTPLHFPVPCSELQVMQMLPCYTFGGPSDATAAPLSVYAYPGER